MIELYTDGSCLNNPSGPGGWGVVILRDGRVVQELSGGEPRTTNNRMEITAAIRGLEQVPVGAEVNLVSDSQYVINTITRGWKRNKNNDLWNDLDEVASARTVNWRWTRGHASDGYNERADQLARAAARAVARANAAETGIAMTGVATNGSTPPKAGPQAEAPDPPYPADEEVAPGEDEEPRLSHVDASGQARMVDVGAKAVTERVAIARARVAMSPATLQLIREGGFAKGDVLGAARIAGVMAAKRTSELIPLCHPIPLTQATVDFDDSGDDTVEIEATARASWKTGVEMEALTACTVAALTIYDMCKAVDRGMRIEAVRLARKSGGKSGEWILEE